MVGGNRFTVWVGEIILEIILWMNKEDYRKPQE